jgi:hypothetical protein
MNSPVPLAADQIVAASQREERLLFWLRVLVSTGVSVCGGMAFWAYALPPKAEKTFGDLLGSLDKLPALTRLMLDSSRMLPGGLAIVAAITLVGAIIPWLKRRLDTVLFLPVVICIALLALFIATLAAILFPFGQILFAYGGP